MRVSLMIERVTQLSLFHHRGVEQRRRNTMEFLVTFLKFDITHEHVFYRVSPFAARKLRI